jgi:hypothetical protein
MTIQLDMFEVQLGAAILLQFGEDAERVRVLADAGVKASGYPRDHVHNKVSVLLDEHGPRRIDLIIGTHYDEDHLLGLVPIIEDETIEIGEAWMPPVVNDALPQALDKRIEADDLLPHQLAGDGGEQVLAEYMAAKRLAIETVRVLEQDDPHDGNLNRHLRELRNERFQAATELDWFRAELGESEEADCRDHGIQQEIDPSPEVERTIALAQSGQLGPFWDYPWHHDFPQQHRLAMAIRSQQPEVGEAQSRSLANIRKAAAKDAINAKALHEVVQALGRRGIAIRCEIIEDGEPRRYRWNPVKRQFLPSRPASGGLTFDLLGPSRSLVNKHRERLPVEDATKVALSFRGELLSITPSNQLSYIGRFECNEQGILVSGDAGCVDFKPRSGPYYPKLLKAMLPLHVVQVAHHAGNNAHFYRVLAAADYPEQAAPSLMLLSHAFHDRTRPSPAFRQFLLETLREGEDVRLLFTSRPQLSKVADYVTAIHPSVGDTGKVGDIQLKFVDGNWSVTRHGVDPSALTN